MKIIIAILAGLAVTYGVFIYTITCVSYDTWSVPAVVNKQTTHNGTIIVWDGDVTWYQHNPSRIVVFKKDGSKVWEIEGNVVSEEKFSNK